MKGSEEIEALSQQASQKKPTEATLVQKCWLGQTRGKKREKERAKKIEKVKERRKKERKKEKMNQRKKERERERKKEERKRERANQQASNEHHNERHFASSSSQSGLTFRPRSERGRTGNLTISFHFFFAFSLYFFQKGNKSDLSIPSLAFSLTIPFFLKKKLMFC